jgi:hypothetical protein
MARSEAKAIRVLVAGKGLDLGVEYLSNAKTSINVVRVILVTKYTIVGSEVEVTILDIVLAEIGYLKVPLGPIDILVARMAELNAIMNTEGQMMRVKTLLKINFGKNYKQCPIMQQFGKRKEKNAYAKLIPKMKLKAGENKRLVGRDRS